MSQPCALILNRIPKMSRKCGARDAEQFRRAPLVAVGLFVNKLNMPPDRASQRKIDTVLAFIEMIRKWLCVAVIFRAVSIWLEIRRENDVLGKNDRTIAEECHRPDGVVEFTQVAAPLVVKKFLHRLRVDRRDNFSFFRSSGCQFRRDQSGKLLNPLCKRRNEQVQ